MSLQRGRFGGYCASGQWLTRQNVDGVGHYSDLLDFVYFEEPFEHDEVWKG